MHITSLRLQSLRDGLHTRLEAVSHQRPQKFFVSPHAAAASKNGSVIASRPLSSKAKTSIAKRSETVRCQAIADDNVDVEPIVVDTTEPAPSPVPSDGASVVLGYFDAFNRRDMDAAIQFISPECVFEDLGEYFTAFILKSTRNKFAHYVIGGPLVLSDSAMREESSQSTLG